MDNSSNDYHISFFKPTTPQALANRNMVVWLVLIWFVAIFGFQILLRVIQKPTPESAYIAYENVWGNIENGSPTNEELKQFGQAALSVLGKSITPEARNSLDNAISWTLYQLISDDMKAEVIAEIQEFERIRTDVENITDPDYIAAKDALSAHLSPILNIASSDVRAIILPLQLSSAMMETLLEETKSSLPGIMEKYLIHNQSFLTDFKFLGFPFHYFYTAIFLLVMFVGLCWLYCVRTDNINRKLNIAD